ncbi:hypothetical protein N7535_006270 [Penicillium sp. DV-2018c]|nr:hypothetical protein N7535_006270 [Penicillium sp. DV-2018c]
MLLPAVGCLIRKEYYSTGPILFLLYMAEAFWDRMGEDAKPIFHERRIGYADDLNSFKVADTLEESTRLAVEDVRRITEWGARNKIVLAPEQFEILHFSRKQDRDAPSAEIEEGLTIHPPQALGGEQPAVRWLGMWFDRKMTWKRHVSTRAKKARAVANHIRSLGRTAHGPPASSLRKAIITCVMPTLLYGAEVWAHPHSGQHPGTGGARGIACMENHSGGNSIQGRRPPGGDSRP